jgi:hypothetical protein
VVATAASALKTTGRIMKLLFYSASAATRPALPDLRIDGIHGRREHRDQQLAPPRSGNWQVPEAKHIRTAVLCLDDRAHPGDRSKRRAARPAAVGTRRDPSKKRRETSAKDPPTGDSQSPSVTDALFLPIAFLER